MFGRLRTFDALESRNFRLLWFGQGAIAMGTWMDQVSRGWLLYQLTESPLQLGLVRAVQAIPFFVLSPIAGTAADRYNRKIQLMISQLLDAVMYGIVAALIISGRIEPWHVYATAFWTSCLQTFQNPARQAMVAESVPTSKLTNAIGLNSVLFNLSRSTGPALAGLLIAGVGTHSAFMAQAGLYVLACGLTFVLPASLSFPADEGSHRSQRHSFLRSIVDGWKFSWSNETVRAGLLITTTASLLIIPFSTQLPVLARDILQVGAQGQGLLLTAMGVGALCSALLVASLGDQAPRGMLMLGGVAMYGLAVMAFASSPWFEASMALMVVVGLFHVSSHALVQTVIQTYSPPELRGRTMGIFQQSHVVQTVGSLLLGGLASGFGSPAAIALMAGAGTLTVGAIFVAMPRARLIR